jgi:twitching motility protein PilI
MMNSSALIHPFSRSRRVQGDPYLKFQLTPNIWAVLAMKQVQEVLHLPIHRLTSMPNLPACILGLTNWRSRVMWVIDLARMLAVASLDTNSQQYDLLLIRVGDLALGLAVQQIGSITWLPSTEIQTPPADIGANLVPYLRGCVLQGQDVVLVLEAEAIAQSSILQRD